MIDIVVGLGFGDEGKGATVASLLLRNKLLFPEQSNCVVRFSGGQQCGHRVVTEDKEHIHSSFGSGGILKIPTYVTEACSMYPVTLVKEMEFLKDSKFIIHPLAKVTTPFEVFANRHFANFNTVGLGVGLTFTRETKPGGNLRVLDIFHNNKSYLQAKLRSIYGDYDEEDFLEFFECIEFLKKNSNFSIQTYDKLSYYDNLIFEGSQGTLLDAEHGIFPDVTYANTTVKNVIPFLRFGELGAVYGCTRSYLTRHGKGWFPETVNINNIHESNSFHEFQGEFRTAKLDYSLLKYAITINKSYLPWNHRFNLVMSCVDVVEPELSAIETLNVDGFIMRDSPISKYEQFLYSS